MIYTIKYQYATYEGTETIKADDSDDAIAKMWSMLKPWLTLPMAYKSATIIKTEEE